MIRTLAGAILLGAISLPAAAQHDEAPAGDDPKPADVVITNSASRDGVDLSGTWGYSIDPYRDGVAGFHGGPVGTGHRRFDPVNVDEATKASPLTLYEYDMRQAPTAQIPGSWDAHAPEMRHYEGLVWYARDFEADLDDDERAFLRIGAANYTAKVWLNGEYLGAHEGGFTPFAFEVTDIVRDGTNTVALGVDSTRTWESVPPPVTDWETYGGITRPVKLVVVPETFIDDAWIRLETDGMIHADVTLDGPDAAGRTVTVEIDGVRGRLSGRTGADGTVSLEMKAPESLDLWSPESPTLYDVTVSARGRDTLNEKIGFRTFETDGEQLLLNGEPIFLRGISLHEEEFGENPARTITEENSRALLTEIKEGLNGNFVRLAHYPHSEITTRLADEMGLVVWSEIPVYWRIDWDNEETLATALAMQGENIRRDRNRASIAFWSIGNETPVSEDRNAFMNALAANVRELDPSRFVTAALLTSGTNEDGVHYSFIDDPLADELDVLAVNTYNGWYGGMPLEEVSESRWRSDLGKPMIFSEYGAGAKLGFSEPDLKRKFSEEYQADYYRETLEMSEHIPFLVGMSPWILKDFRSPRRQHPVWQEGWNRKGLVTETGERKPAFFVLSDHYKKLEEEGAE